MKNETINEATNVQGLAALHRDIAEIAAKAEVKRAAKGNFGTYADLPSIVAAVAGLLAERGIIVTTSLVGATWSHEDRRAMVTATAVTTARRGDDLVEVELPVAHMASSPAYAAGGATTYARRYGLAAVLGLAAGEEDDPEIQGDPPAARPQGRSPSPRRAAIDHALREARGDWGGAQRLVEAAVGYRLGGPLREIADGDAAAYLAAVDRRGAGGAL